MGVGLKSLKRAPKLTIKTRRKALSLAIESASIFLVEAIIRSMTFIQ